MNSKRWFHNFSYLSSVSSFFSFQFSSSNIRLCESEKCSSMKISLGKFVHCEHEVESKTRKTMILLFIRNRFHVFPLIFLISLHCCYSQTRRADSLNFHNFSHSFFSFFSKFSDSNENHIRQVFYFSFIFTSISVVFHIQSTPQVGSFIAEANFNVLSSFTSSLCGDEIINNLSILEHQLLKSSTTFLSLFIPFHHFSSFWVLSAAYYMFQMCVKRFRELFLHSRVFSCSKISRRQSQFPPKTFTQSEANSGNSLPFAFLPFFRQSDEQFWI